MADYDINVKVDAEFVWLFPAETAQEKTIRDLSNIRIKAAADKLNLAVKLILMEMLSE